MTYIYHQIFPRPPKSIKKGTVKNLVTDMTAKI